MTIENRAEYKSYIKQKIDAGEGDIDINALAELITNLEWRLSSCERRTAPDLDRNFPNGDTI